MAGARAEHANRAGRALQPLDDGSLDMAQPHREARPRIVVRRVPAHVVAQVRVVGTCLPAMVVSIHDGFVDTALVRPSPRAVPVDDPPTDTRAGSDAARSRVPERASRTEWRGGTQADSHLRPHPDGRHRHPQRPAGPPLSDRPATGKSDVSGSRRELREPADRSAYGTSGLMSLPDTPCRRAAARPAHCAAPVVAQRVLAGNIV
jgi:hypothetical protein